MKERPRDELARLLLEKRVVVCVGSGGVGKTTTSAALALKAAELGRKACVLTIDPAKRLANSLGLKALGNHEARIRIGPASGIEAADGQLWAMMLDTKRTWDELIGRFAADAAARDRILANPYYQQISSALSGSTEFMAMEKLYELHEEGRYDLLVLDTPPTRHALDFLDAPKKMIGLMDEGVIRLLVSPSVRAGRLGLGMLRSSTAFLFGVLERVTGFEVMRDLADFVGSFGGMYGGFQQRAARVQELLRQDDTAFLLVTSPNHSTVEEAIYFHRRLSEYGLPFGGFVVNRVHADPLAGNGLKTEWRRMRRDPAALLTALGSGVRGKAAESLAERMAQNFENFQALAEVDRAQIELLRESCDGKSFWREVPQLDLDVHDLSGLVAINAHLFGH